MSLVLASASPARRALLKNAGLNFEVVPAEIDERAAEQPLVESGAPPEDIALTLAMAKAASVGERRPDDLVIGADQVLAFEDERMSKPADMEAARRQLLKLSGKTHSLLTAVACARGEEIVWQHVEAAHLTMRKLEPAFVGRYLAAAGSEALTSVGAYQIERRGIQLFETIDGDYFSILGLPLLPLLAFLRGEGIVE
jgi:nucleoside triphosphate pyrophosphatase